MTLQQPSAARAAPSIGRFVVPATVMLSFVSLWRAAAIVVSDRGSSASNCGISSPKKADPGGTILKRSLQTMNNQDTVVRRFQRQRATFVSFKGNDQVEMLVGGRVLAIGKEDWICLPPIDNLDAAGRALVAPMSG